MEISITLTEVEAAAVDRVCARTGQTRYDLAANLLRRHLALSTFEDLRAQMMPFAAARGFLTDEDVFGDRT